MNDGENFTIDQTQGNQPLFAIILSVIHPRQHVILEYKRCMQYV
jgi:hypothetical protein